MTDTQNRKDDFDDDNFIIYKNNIRWSKSLEELNDGIIKKNEGEYLMSPSYGISIADSLSYGDKYIVVHNDAYEYLTRKSHKKIKRRLYYDVYFYYGGERQSHYFESAKKMRKFVNNIHELVSCDVPGVRIEKTWCYREHSPRHKWYYVSYYPNQFVCVEKY